MFNSISYNWSKTNDFGKMAMHLKTHYQIIIDQVATNPKCKFCHRSELSDVDLLDGVKTKS